MNFNWTAKAKLELSGLLRAGKSATEISVYLGVSRGAVSGIVFRDAELAKIGFSKRGKSRNGGQTKRFSMEDREERRRQYNRAYKAMQRAGAVVIAFPTPTRALPADSPQIAKRPQLRVVSNNVPLMVEDWLAKNGGARKFEHAATADTWAIRQYLVERGITTNGFRGKWSISSGRGRPKIVSWGDVMAIVDKFRLSEGLQPFSASMIHEAKRAASS